ncbi:MAG TPA: haloacid dehalogenase type II [Bryobacteraceae bacterium]|jgi:2-haloacid dehalogenase|nr:haloacid dehalogenase type II [Bryobacteraceae bacterium]
MIVSNPEDFRKQNDRPSILVFDVNETLLDIEAMAPLFAQLFGDAQVLREWFGQLVLYSGVVTLSGLYQDFFALGQGVLRMLAEIHKVDIHSSDIDELKTRMLNMPAHPDVPPGLSLLKNAGFRLVTLTNSPTHPQGSPLERAGMARFFERQFSVDSVQQFKPAPKVYQMVASMLDAPVSSLCMVASHVWDTIGAQSAGYSAALLARSGNVPLTVDGLPQPDCIAPDLVQLANQLIRFKRTARLGGVVRGQS